MLSSEITPCQLFHLSLYKLPVTEGYIFMASRFPFDSFLYSGYCRNLEIASLYVHVYCPMFRCDLNTGKH